MINFINVSIKHSDSRGINNVSFDITKGTFVYLMGPTGAGKSTVINAILRSISPSSGQIIINNLDISSFNDSDLAIYRRSIGMIFQDFKLLHDRTIFENIALPLQIIGATQNTINRRVNELLLKINLSKKKYAFPNELSGGEQQKVCVARALIKNPKIC